MVPDTQPNLKSSQEPDQSKPGLPEHSPIADRFSLHDNLGQQYLKVGGDTVAEVFGTTEGAVLGLEQFRSLFHKCLLQD